MMRVEELKKLFDRAGKRYHLVGNDIDGVLIGLDLEGRLFTIAGGKVMNKVNPEAVLEQPAMTEYLNPGGDGLWPAPEGTCLGYEYPAGIWRVPPGLTGARYIVKKSAPDYAEITAEIDLVNNSGTGIPAVFGRAVSIKKHDSSLAVNCIESIKYAGSRELYGKECLLAPWSLCQFNTAPGCHVIFPAEDDSCCRDLYESSSGKRRFEDGLCRTDTDGELRYQIGLDNSVPWIEFRCPAEKLKVRRSAGALPEGQDYIDIADAPPSAMPSDKGVSLSVYNDPGFFMEIEAAGGCPGTIRPGDVMSLEVNTVYSTG
jgi:hypothetical protein